MFYLNATAYDARDNMVSNLFTIFCAISSGVSIIDFDGY